MHVLIGEIARRLRDSRAPRMSWQPPPGAGIGDIPLTAWLAIVTAILGLSGGTYFFANKQPSPSVPAPIAVESEAPDLASMAQEAANLIKAAQELGAIK